MVCTDSARHACCNLTLVSSDQLANKSNRYAIAQPMSRHLWTFYGSHRIIPIPLSSCSRRLLCHTDDLSLRPFRLDALLVFQDGPVENVVVLEPLADEKVAEELAEVAIVRLVIKAQRANVVEVRGEFLGKPLAQLLDRSAHLLLRNFLILLLLVCCPQSLPRQTAPVEVHKNIPQRLEVIAAALLDPQMRVDACITRGASQVLVLPIRYMLVGLGVAVLLRQAEVDDVDLVGLLAETHEEIVGLDVSVNEAL